MVANQRQKIWVISLLVLGLIWAIFSLSPTTLGQSSERIPAITTTPSPTSTVTSTVTITPTVTVTPTVTLTPTITATPTIDPLITLEPQNYLPAIAKDPSPTPTETPTPTPAPACLPWPEIPPGSAVNEATIRGSINQQRGDNGLPALAQTHELEQSSRRHSLDMAENHFTAHTGSDGSTAAVRMREACYDWNYWGEIIGWGFGGDPAAMMDWWLNSPVHRAMILNGFVQDFGVGYIRLPGSDWTHYWTVNFGRRATLAPVETEKLYLCQFSLESEWGGSSVRFFSAQPCGVYE